MPDCGIPDRSLGVDRIAALCAASGMDADDPLRLALTETYRASVEARSAAERIGSPDTVRQLARSAASGASHQAGRLAMASIRRTALLAAVALAVAGGAGGFAGYALRGDPLRAACIEQGQIRMARDPGTGRDRPYCAVALWVDESQR